MMTTIAALWARLKDDTAWLVLFAVAVIGAWLYVEFQQMRTDRDALAHTAEVICASAGAGFDASAEQAHDANGKPVIVAHSRGAACQRQVADLATFKAHTDEVTAATLAKALADHDARQNSDNLAARTAAEAARSAALRMEAADAEAERKNLVDREWFAAVNGVAGLRAAAASHR